NIKISVTENNIQKLIRLDDRRRRLGAKIYVYAPPLLKKLRKMGYKIGLISNSNIFAIKNIRQTGILKYVDYPLFAFQIGAIKPDLKIYKKMLSMAKCQPAEAIMIGDKMGDDVVPPRKMGMRAIHFTGYQNLKKSLKKYNINL
ncbi:MAG: HAD family hydrolase, partial [Candidatus Parcubacteria bacterium]|nr:HAD family hydrolase [Candidatus Parcubacteria bacterium]